MASENLLSSRTIKAQVLNCRHKYPAEKTFSAPCHIKITINPACSISFQATLGSFVLSDVGSQYCYTKLHKSFFKTCLLLILIVFSQQKKAHTNTPLPCGLFAFTTSPLSSWAIWNDLTAGVRRPLSYWTH